ncbi:unnamed protein product [Arabis nemorensis]|uniref:Uncharacterized protein n=1 Tax=Arabis nemorensis TaxID=586526 RepID=A0A565AXL9_9BRAS|nr:unnamed protein product [Arabis nemorensis]
MVEEVVSAVNQTLPNSGGEAVNFTAYSAAVHKVVVMVNAGILALLQLMNQQNSSVLETHKTAFLCFCVFVLFYAVLRVREAMDVRLRPGLSPRLVGHTSHMFGGLASLVLIHMVCATFSLVLLILWFLWLSFVVYDTISEVMIYSKTNKSDDGLPQFPPV